MKMKIKHTERKQEIKKERRRSFKDVFNSLFQYGVESYDFLPLERKYLMKKVRKTLELLLNIPYQVDSKESKVKTRYGELELFNYIRRFTRNLFKCFVSCDNYMKGNFNPANDIPNRLYHGTTTIFLPEIKENGLLPSKAGQVWEQDRNRKPQKIYLTDSMYIAEICAFRATELGGEPIVLEVGIKGMKDKMEIRKRISTDNGSTIFDIFKEISFKEPIPLNRIKNWYLPPKPPAGIMLMLVTAEKGNK